MNALSETINDVGVRGWTAEFDIVGSGVRCGRCHRIAAPEAVVVDGIDRFEGPSDPADECVLFALTAPCGHRGTLVSEFGAGASGEAAEVISHLGLRRP